MLVKQQDKPKALHGLDGHGSATDGVVSLLQELGGESTKSGTWSWHCGFRSLLGFLRVHLFLQKSAETTTLFVKQTTKGPGVRWPRARLIGSRALAGKIVERLSPE
jgi:hypothetical protein